jgi:hypothetical protein
MALMKHIHVEIVAHAYRISLCLLVLFGAALVPLQLLSTSYALGTASFALSPASGSYANGQTFNLIVDETSTDSVNAVQLDMSYPSASLRLNSVSSGTAASSPFGLCGQSAGGSGTVSVGCASTLSVTGTQPVANINFTVIASSGSAAVNVTTGSSIVRTSDQANVWNNLPTAATYTISSPTTSAPVVTTPQSSNSSTTKPKTTTASKPATVVAAPAEAQASSSSAPIAPTPVVVPTSEAAASSGATITTPTSSVASTSIPMASPTAFEIKVLTTSGTPEANAVVTINGSKETTNSAGVATFTSLQPKQYEVTITAPGSKKATASSIDVMPKQSTQQFSIRLDANHSSSTTPVLLLVMTLLLVAAAAAVVHYLTQRKFLARHTAIAAPITAAVVVPLSVPDTAVVPPTIDPLVKESSGTLTPLLIRPTPTVNDDPVPAPQISIAPLQPILATQPLKPIESAIPKPAVVEPPSSVVSEMPESTPHETPSTSTAVVPPDDHSAVSIPALESEHIVVDPEKSHARRFHF